MTTNQIFNAIDLTSDKYLNEVLENELETNIRKKAGKSRFMLKIIAVSAACLTLAGAGLALIPKRDEIGALFGKPARGIIRQIDKDIVDGYLLMPIITFGGFSYNGIQDTQMLNIKSKTAVNTELTISSYGVYSTNKIPARLFMLSDGEPIEFKLDGSEPDFYHDVEFTNENPGCELKRTFPVEFNASISDKQITAFVSFFPDEIFDNNDLVTPQRSRSALVSVRNTAADPSYDYSRFDSLDNDGSITDFNHIFFNTDNSLNNYNLCFNKNRCFLKKDTQINVSINDKIARRLYVMIDGELLNCFGGKYYHLVEPGYEIAPLLLQEYIPDNGLHDIQVFLESVIPDNVTDQVDGYASAPITMLCGRDIEELKSQCKDTILNSSYHYDLKFIISCDKPEYKQRDNIKVKATIRNYGSRIIKLHSTVDSAGITMELEKNGYTLVGNAPDYDPQTAEEPIVIELQPGEEYVVEFTFKHIIKETGAAAEQGIYNGTCSFAVWETSGIYSALNNRSIDFRIII